MSQITIYIPAGKEEYIDKFKAIENKSEWLMKHLDSDVQREIVFANPTEVVQPNQVVQTPNVPRPDFVSVYLWNTWLKDNGFEVEE